MLDKHWAGAGWHSHSLSLSLCVLALYINGRTPPSLPLPPAPGALWLECEFSRFFFSFRCCWFVKCCVWRWLVVWLCKCNNKQICLFVDQNGNFLLLFCFCSVLSHVLTFYTLFIYFSPFLRSRYVSLLTPRSVMEHKYRIGVVVLYNACIYDKRKFPRYCYGRISLIYNSVLSTNTSWRMAMPPFKATTPYKICIVKGCARGNAQSSSQLACYFTIWKTNSRYAFWI